MAVRKRRTQTKSAGSEKAKSKRWQLINIKDLPHYLRDNEYLLDSHRPTLPSVRQCISSVFSMHTETFNIWTHLIGCIGMIVVAIYFLTLPDVSLTQKLWFSSFFAGAIICMGFSTIYHTMLCYSENVYRWLAKADYCGIVVLICASFPPWVNYCFYCHWSIKLMYLVAVGALGAVCIYVVVGEAFSSIEYRVFRAVLFIALGLTGVFPAGHYMMSNGLSDALEHLPWLVFMAVLYICGGIIYAVRIPERLLPGKFDIWCHSHQFLHLCVVGGVVSCYCGIQKIAGDKIGMDCNFTTIMES